MQNLLNDLLAKDTTMGIGCDNMTAILVRFNQWLEWSFIQDILISYKM